MAEPIGRIALRRRPAGEVKPAPTASSADLDALERAFFGCDPSVVSLAK